MSCFIFDSGILELYNGVLFNYFYCQINDVLSLISGSFQGSLLAAPIIVYSNAETGRSQILLGNKDKASVYKWTHFSGKFYIGFAIDLSKRFRFYFSESYLNRCKSMYICNALFDHGDSSFSLTILEYLDITNLSKDESRKLLLQREQHYINTLSPVRPPPPGGGPVYNINPIAESRLGSLHTEETIARMSGENNNFYGKFHTPETLAKCLVIIIQS